MFTYSRQRPTHEPNEAEDLGPVNFPEFIIVFRSIDWRHEANQAKWAMKAWPTVEVTNQIDGCTLWMSALLADSPIDVDAAPNERFKIDNYEPWYSVGLQDPPKFSNVTRLDPFGVGDDFGFTASATERIEECFELFFEEDYQSLYESFHWV